MKTMTSDEFSRDSLRRSKLETSVDVLRVIAEGAVKPTHIMYRANLSWTAMQYYLTSLMARGLVTLNGDEGRKNYQLTERGYTLLQDYLTVRKQLNSEGIAPEKGPLG